MTISYTINTTSPVQTCIILKLQSLYVLAIKVVESKQNFITGIKNVVYKVVDFSLLFHSESLLAARFSRNYPDNVLSSSTNAFSV